MTYYHLGVVKIYLYIPHIIHSKLLEFPDFCEMWSALIFLCIFTSAGEHTNLALGGVQGKLALGFSSFMWCISKF